MLRRGEEQCTDEKPAEPDLFDDKQKEDPTFEGTPSGNGDGVVKGPKAATTDAASDVAEAELQPEAEAKPEKVKKPGWGKKFWNRLTGIAESLVEEH
jgi:hypothetical protein